MYWKGEGSTVQGRGANDEEVMQILCMKLWLASLSRYPTVANLITEIMWFDVVEDLEDFLFIYILTIL